MHKWINKSGPGRAKGPPGPLSPGYFNPIKNTPNRKNRFVKTPLFPSPFGQNKTSKLSQNNVVINTGTKGWSELPSRPHPNFRVKTTITKPASPMGGERVTCMEAFRKDFCWKGRTEAKIFSPEPFVHTLIVIKACISFLQIGALGYQTLQDILDWH
jgi:hypothetical protein